MSNPFNVFEVAHDQAVGSRAWGVAVGNNYTYLAAQYLGLEYYNIEVIEECDYISNVDTIHWAYQIALVNDLALVADGLGGMAIINIEMLN